MKKSDFPTYQHREDIPERYTWDIASVFASVEDCVKAITDAQGLPEAYAAWESKALHSAQELLGYLRFDDEAELTLDRIGEYVFRRADEDHTISRFQDLKNQVVALSARTSAAAAWFEPALMALDDATLEGWYQELPALAQYRRALDKVRALRDHVLPPAEEALLAKAQEMAAGPGQVFSMLNDADLTFPDAIDSQGKAHHVTHGSYGVLLQDKDRTLRESAYHSVYGTYDKIKNTSAAVLGSQMKQLAFFADARHYGSSLEASLAPTEIPLSVYDGLIDAVHQNAPTMHRYMSLRARALGLSPARYWDVYVPIVDTPERCYSFEEACDLMLDALAPLGEDYVAQVRKAIDERWYDVYETPGKASGAYSSGGRGVRPLILLNFQGALEDVFTLVHETGHSMHTFLTNRAQPTRYAAYEMFVAEVASTTNEMLLMHHLFDHATDDAMRAFLLDHLCNQFKSTLYRQTMFAEFERDANGASAKGEGTGADALSERYRALNDLYYGPANVSDGEIALEWSRIPHFYYNYYVYVYATSFAAAVALSERILREGEPARKRYLEFLSSGNSRPPIDLLAGAGVDMASGVAVSEALASFAQTVERLERLLALTD